MTKRRYDFGMGIASCSACSSWPILNRGCGECSLRLCSKCSRDHLKSCVHKFANAREGVLRPPGTVTNSVQEGKRMDCSGGNRQPYEAAASVEDASTLAPLAPQPPTTEVTRKATMLDSYILGSVLGRGACGVVYACKPKNQIMFTQAMKFVDRLGTSIAQIEGEIAVMEKFDHENVAKLYDVFYDQRYVCLVMDRYSGDMFAGIRSHLKTKGAIAPKDVVHVIRQMIAAIEHMHAFSVIHRDVKGENFLMTHRDIVHPRNKVVISDFGTSQILSSVEERLTTPCGTQEYWAPEIYDKNYSLKADVWALGVNVYGMLAMTFPFRDEISVRQKKINFERFGSMVADLVHNCLEKVESKRLSAGEALSHPWFQPRLKWHDRHYTV